MKIELKGNQNYSAVVVGIEKIQSIEGADKIAITPIFSNSIIVGKDDTPVGTKGIYFPLETSISKEFLSKNNLLRNKEENSDKNKTGFFEENGRVKALRMMKGTVKSEGFFIPMAGIKNYIGSYKEEDFPLGLAFDTIDGKTLCKKYVLPSNQSAISGNKNERKSVKKNKSKLVSDQFHFHIDTPQLKLKIKGLKPSDLVSITTKIHGSSFISAKLLCKKKLNPIEKVLKFLDINIVDSHYDYVWSSRRVLKGDIANVGKGFYDEDIWKIIHDRIKDNLQDGMTIYGEVYGQLLNGKWIQKEYDYGTNPGEMDYMVYRITTTNLNGKVFEWSTQQVKQYCTKLGMKSVPELYYGTLQNYLDSRKVKWNEENFHEILLQTLSNEYLEKDSALCKNKVPEEGIVLRRESLDIEVWKLKSFTFLERETKALDKGETNVEDNQ